MYAETELLFPCFQNFSQDVQLQEFCHSQKSSISLNSTISEYDLGGEGDLFKAPEPIIEEPMMGLDPMMAAISMISCGDDVISTQALKDADIESMQSEQLLEVFYECKKDILAKSAMESPPVSDLLDIKVPVAKTDNTLVLKDNLISEVPLQKSVSSGCLSSMEWVNSAAIAMRPHFLDFPGMDFGSVYGMRRAFSDGDIKTLGNGNLSLIHSPLEQPFILNCTSEERRQKLNRYRNKKTKRNFGRKIKYACRKALADSQPRIRGRFAKTDESEICKKQ